MKPYYEHAGITIYHGDCREVLPTLPPADLIFTSPPYNLGTGTTGGQFPGKRLGHYAANAPFGRARSGMGKWQRATSPNGLAHGYGDFADAMPHDEYVTWQKEILTACWNLLSESGAIFYNHKPRILNGEVLTPLTYNPGLPLRQIVIWARAGGINFNPAFYVPTHEWILIFAKPDFRLRDRGASGIGDVWYVPQQADEEHPAPFPLSLPLRALETTLPGPVVDPFCGTGTTLRAAKEIGRTAIGIDIEERYCEIAADRLSQEVLQFT